jgi:hypothetical protein
MDTKKPVLIVNQGPMAQLRIDEMFAFIASDETGEGVCACYSAEGWMPMVGADWARFESYKEIAQRIATEGKKEIHLVKFSKRELLQTIRP